MKTTERFERDYLRSHQYCDYCKALGAQKRAAKVVLRQYGPKELYVSLCEDHFERLREIEGE